MQRTLQPELLDSLPPGHPDALHNRRDLRILHAITGNSRWLLRTLRRVSQPGERLLELGAGTGDFGLKLAARGIVADGLDLWPRPDAWPEAAAWHSGDLRTFDGYAGYDVVFGSLILHQFENADLAELGAKLRQRARVIVAIEPVRRRASQVLFRSLGPVFGANHVSLHDAHVSIAAGFRQRELPEVLGLSTREWEVSVNTTPLGMYRFMAVRRA